MLSLAYQVWPHSDLLICIRMGRIIGQRDTNPHLQYTEHAIVVLLDMDIKRISSRFYAILL
jgi:hypothetical protein